MVVQSKPNDNSVAKELQARTLKIATSAISEREFFTLWARGVEISSMTVEQLRGKVDILKKAEILDQLLIPIDKCESVRKREYLTKEVSRLINVIEKSEAAREREDGQEVARLKKQLHDLKQQILREKVQEDLRKPGRRRRRHGR